MTEWQALLDDFFDGLTDDRNLRFRTVLFRRLLFARSYAFFDASRKLSNATPDAFTSILRALLSIEVFIRISDDTSQQLWKRAYDHHSETFLHDDMDGVVMDVLSWFAKISPVRQHSVDLEILDGLTPLSEAEILTSIEEFLALEAEEDLIAGQRWLKPIDLGKDLILTENGSNGYAAFKETGLKSDFWQEWLESVINGQPLAAELILQVLRLPEDVWTQGASLKLDSEASRLYGAFVVREDAKSDVARNPLALAPFEVVSNGAKKLDAAPKETPDLSDVIGDINRALERFNVACNDPNRGGNTGPIFCGYITFNMEELQDDLDHYSGVPGKILQALQVFTETVEDIAADSEVTTPRPFATLLARIKNAQTEIARLSPSVHEEDRARFRIMVELTNRDHLRRQFDMLATLPNDTHGLLHAEVTRCLAVIQDPESGDREFAHASYLLRALPPTLALFIEDQDKEEGTASPLDRLSKVAKVAEDADKLVDIGQEAVEEWGLWLSQYWLELLTKGAG